MQESRVNRTRFERADPILRVDDMDRSVRYYVNVLGFVDADWGTSDFTCVTRDAAAIYLSLGNQGQPGTWVWVGVDSVDVLFREYQKTGAVIADPPRNFPWAYEMKGHDPDGHVLRFGSGPRDDIPLE